MLDCEIVCLDADGRTNFYNLLFRRDGRTSSRFDLLLAVDGEDLRTRPLVERKRLAR